jgi:hypothetical protein
MRRLLHWQQQQACSWSPCHCQAHKGHPLLLLLPLALLRLLLLLPLAIELLLLLLLLVVQQQGNRRQRQLSLEMTRWVMFITQKMTWFLLLLLWALLGVQIVAGTR